jgi:glutathione S-transferase
LPFLHVDASVIAGSAAIVDWGDARAAQSRRLAGADPQHVYAIEQRLDAVIGVHVRRYYYSDALLTDPAAVRPIVSRDLPLLQKWAVTLGWSQIVPRMISGMDLGQAQGIESRKVLLGELDWLDSLLADGRPYLTGSTFTRADLTAASLLAPLVNPAKHPSYAALAVPAALAETIKQWKTRPILRWVTDIYERHR